jgi:DNA polymerase III subunit gamma/tau
MLSASAFNAFLKTLEEPPPYAIFILATTEKHKILPTILSRCQIFDFKRITNNDTVEHLQEIVDKESIKAEKAALQVIAQKSEGCMRDSLSILDKIVSFTNGTLTYQNTLEHLNILDDDYYFKLLEAMQQQDLSAAMLLFDQINRKGFEGDLVLNGFAEFIRNLLVCKDPISAALLEVVEGLQEKYTATAQRAGVSFLVSALNILNEAEINYKMARNKRLHVELALIKLNFLQQAIELSADGGQLVKKKRLDQPIAFHTKAVPPIQMGGAAAASNAPSKPAATEAKLYVENPKPSDTAVPKPTQPTAAKPSNSSVAAPKPAIAAPIPSGPSKLIPPVNSGGGKKGLLDTLREKYGDQYAIQEVPDAEVLNMEKLQACWNEYTKSLEQQLKHSSAGTFRIARLTIEDEIHFNVLVGSLTSQKFVEQEKMLLLEHIQKAFFNPGIMFQVLVEAGEQEEVPAHLRMNSRQKFERIAEQFPMVKELKDRLKLEIDY